MENQKILIVDDDQTNLKILEKFLLSDGYSVAQASNGLDALTIAREWHPELIILDIMMPGMDGGEVALILEKDPNTSDIPIIFLTSLLRKTEERKTHNNSRKKYMAKPFHPQVLLNEIKNSLEAQSISKQAGG